MGTYSQLERNKIVQEYPSGVSVPEPHFGLHKVRQCPSSSPAMRTCHSILIDKNTFPKATYYVFILHIQKSQLPHKLLEEHGQNLEWGTAWCLGKSQFDISR